MRILKHLLLAVIAAICLLLVLVFVVEPLASHRRVRQAAITALSTAKTINELQQAVGGLGIFVPLQDGSWIAIVYHDIHAARISSLAIARDSGGNWFESDRHFCGTLSAYRQERQSRAEMRSELAKLGEIETNSIIDSRSGIFMDLDSLFAAPSLDAGRKQLWKLGFKPFTQ